MGMPIAVEIVDPGVRKNDFDSVYSYFTKVDEKFSPYRKDSEVTRVNKGSLRKDEYSVDLKSIFLLSEKTKKETHGFFDIKKNGVLDPSGIVKGWAIFNAAALLKKRGFGNFYIDVGGDIEVSGKNAKGKNWQIGIRNPFDRYQNIKTLSLADRGVATSGTSIRGQHIYNPHNPDQILDEIVSITVVGPDVYEADRFATAAFAMGSSGISFIESRPNLEGYMISKTQVATMTSGFEKYQV